MQSLPEKMDMNHRDIRVEKYLIRELLSKIRGEGLVSNVCFVVSAYKFSHVPTGPLHEPRCYNILHHHNTTIN